jgi:hypothetical protein
VFVQWIAIQQSKLQWHFIGLVVGVFVVLGYAKYKGGLVI